MSKGTSYVAKVLSKVEKNGEIHVKLSTEALEGDYTISGIGKVKLMKSQPGYEYAQVNVEATNKNRAFFAKAKTLELTA